MRPSSACAGYATGHAIKVLGLSPELGVIARRRAPARCWAGSSACLAIRRQGIYFAMITLALAQMVYFFCLQAQFTGGEDGLQGVPARHACSACARPGR
jgi:branched-chain amino acid transport system permease protein